VLSALVLVRRGDRVDLETAWIEGPAKAANEAALLWRSSNGTAPADLTVSGLAKDRELQPVDFP
jgi:hypothetical protein